MPEDGFEEPLYRVVCAAVRLTNGIVIGSARHFDSVMDVTLSFLSSVGISLTGDCGFLNNKSEFMTREQAWVIAEKAGQIRKRLGQVPGILQSEDLY